MNKAEIIEVCQEYDIHPRHSIGQNFLCNSSVAQSISVLAKSSSCTSILEIGPGLGALTSYLCDYYDQVTAIEIDHRLIPYLSNRFSDRDGFTLYQGDYLKMNIAEMINLKNKPDAVVSNLPYYITTPIVLKAITDFSNAEKMVFMIEEDAATRFFAHKGTKSYGPLSILTSLFGSKEKSMTVDSKSFFPAPKTQSSVIVLKRSNEAVNINMDLLTFIQVCFKNRRKTLVNNLRVHYQDLAHATLLEIIDSLNLDTTIRADMIDPHDFSILYSRLFESSGTIQR